MVEVCSVCEGSGLRIVQEDGRQVARPCECRIERRAARMLERAHIPKRYEHCTLENYETGFRGADGRLKAARLRAQKFVEGYPVETAGTGLLLTGSIGVGKTHLAVGILQALVAERGRRAVLRLSRPAEAGAEQLQPAGAATELESCGRCSRPRCWCWTSWARPSRPTGCGTRSRTS
jgi:hypothetical protein